MIINLETFKRFDIMTLLYRPYSLTIRAAKYPAITARYSRGVRAGTRPSFRFQRLEVQHEEVRPQGPVVDPQPVGAGAQVQATRISLHLQLPAASVRDNPYGLPIDLD